MYLSISYLVLYLILHVLIRPPSNRKCCTTLSKGVQQTHWYKKKMLFFMVCNVIEITYITIKKVTI